MSLAKPFAWVVWDGERLSGDPRAAGRRMRADGRCLAGPAVAGAYAHVCALPDKEAALRFDEPEVQHARRDALAWWIPLLADDLICITTLALDASRYAGAITVSRSPARFEDDPFARLFPATTVATDIFSAVAPPAGPVIERVAGAPWLGGSLRRRNAQRPEGDGGGMEGPAFSGLLIVAAAAFAAPFLLGFFPAVKLPAVVLEIVAGIAIGASELGWVHIDPTESRSV